MVARVFRVAVNLLSHKADDILMSTFCSYRIISVLLSAYNNVYYIINQDVIYSFAHLQSIHKNVHM